MLEKLKQGQDARASTDWGRVFLFFAGGVVAAFQVGKAPPVLPLLRIELGLSLVMAGWVLSATSILGAFTAPGIGAVSDWLGHRRMMSFGLACSALGSLTGSFATTSVLLLGSRFIEGIGYILIAVSVPGLILQVTRKSDVRMAFGVWGSFMPVGTSTMMLLAPFLVDLFGWRGLWRTNALIPFSFAILLVLATRGLDSHGTRGKNPSKNLIKDVWLTLKTPGPLLLALCFAAYSFQFVVVTGFLPTLLFEEHGVTQVRAAVLSAVVVAINAPGNLFGGWLLQRGVKRWHLVAVANLISGLCCLGIYKTGMPLPSTFLLCLVFSGVGGMFPAAALHGAAVNAPTSELVATSQGLLLQGAQLGLLTGPPIAATVVSRTGDWQSASWVLMAVALLVVALSFVLGAVERRKGIE
ncbi:MAG: MFS transporter [Desulfobacteraceae bacterium]|jgi:MFS family permease